MGVVADFPIAARRSRYIHVAVGEDVVTESGTVETGFGAFAAVVVGGAEVGFGEGDDAVGFGVEGEGVGWGGGLEGFNSPYSSSSRPVR